MKKALIIALADGFIRTFLENDIILLKKRGYEIHCAGRTTGREENFALRKKYGIVFHELEFSGRKPITGKNLKALADIIRLIRSEDFDVIHCHTPIVATLTKAASAICRFRKRGILIYSSHGFYFHRHASKKAWLLYYPIEWLTAPMCDGVITINCEDYENALKMPYRKVFKINGVGMDRSRFAGETVDRSAYRKSLGIGEDDLMIMSMGQLSTVKNHELAIRGIAKSGIENAVLVLCGDETPGSGRLEYLKDLADKLGVNVKFLGYRTDVSKIAKCADIGTIPSKKEGLGMAGLEMLTAGLPLISSDVHGIMDYMENGINGYVVGTEDDEAYARALVLLSEGETREKMRPACEKSSEPFDKEISMHQLDDIYNRILK